MNRLNRFKVQGAGFKVRLGSGFMGSGVSVLLALAAPGVAGAQAAPPRVEVGGGLRRVGGAPLGDMDAKLGTASGGTFVQFGSSSELGATPAVEGRVGVRLTRSLWAEASVSYGTTELETRLDSDVESIPDTTVSESIARYTIEGALVASLDGWRWGAVVPFVSLGGGYLRELHEGRTFVESGRLLHAGGGVTVPLRTEAGAGTTAGIRADARAIVRSGGVQFDDDVMIVPAAGVSVFFRF
jgi:hypothetical protein